VSRPISRGRGACGTVINLFLQSYCTMIETL
jgi:hypothetical protein